MLTSGRTRRTLLVIALALRPDLSEAGRPPVPLDFERLPYLQQLGSHSVIITWRTTVPSLGSVVLDAEPGAEMEIPRGESPERIHEVLLEQLEPGVEYEYRVTGALPPEGGGAPVDGPEEIFAGPFRFRTAPADSAVPIRIGVFGDAGAGTEAQLAVRDILVEMSPDILLVTGDLVYSAGLDETYQARFFDVYRELLSTSCVYPAVGNHDVIFGYESYLSQFVLPRNSLLDTETFYSFDFGAGHFVILDTNETFSGGSSQLDWLRADLAATTKPWKIVASHRPLYTTGPHGRDPDKLPRREWLAPIFEEFGVDLVLCGHDHIYERTFPIRGEVAHDGWQGNVYRSPLGPIYVVTGGGGAILYPRADTADLRHSAFFASIHHAVDITLTAAELTMRARAIDGSVLDPVTIRRESRPTFAFVHGDTNFDSQIGIGDAVRVLDHLFLGRPLECPVTGDWDASGVLELADPIASLGYQFLGGAPPPLPFPECVTGSEDDDAFCRILPCP